MSDEQRGGMDPEQARVRKATDQPLPGEEDDLEGHATRRATEPAPDEPETDDQDAEGHSTRR